MNNIHINMNEFTNASRVLKQVNSLSKNKVFEKITIIALGSEKLKEYEKIDDNIELYRIRLSTRNLPKGLFFQLIKYFEFLIRTTIIFCRLKPKVVNAHALSVLPFALLAKYLFQAAIVYDAHELETEQVSGMNLRKKLSKWLERKLIYKVNLMFVVSESIADWYVKHYNINRPSVVLNAPKRRELKSNNHFREQLPIRDEQIILLYQGGLFSGRGVQLILDAFKARTDDKIVVVFMGYGELEQDIKSAALTSNNIFFFPAVPPQIVLEYTSSADLGISLIERTCLSYYYCMPNKLFEYSMAGLPVLVSNMKDMSDLVTDNYMGIVISNFSASGVNQALDEFLNHDLAVMKENSYRTACDNSWEIQEQKMLAAYKKMFQKGL